MIHYFNPGHESAVLNESPYYMPPRNVAIMQSDLALLPLWYAEAGDIIFTSNTEIETIFHSQIHEHLDIDVRIGNKSDLVKFKNQELCFWGISPQVICYFNNLKTELGLELNIPEWNKDLKYLNSRMAAKDCLTKMTSLNNKISNKIIPDFCYSLEDIEEKVINSTTQLLAKAPYSSSGRGLLWLPIGGLTQTERQILSGTLKKQGCVSIERKLNKKLDFAMEFMSDGKGQVSFQGYSLFETNMKGAYLGNFIGSQDDILKEINNFIKQPLLDEINNSLINILSEKYGMKYKGCIGVDMLVYCNENNEYMLHPCLEINMRYNMGYLAIKFSGKYLSEGKSGKFYIDFSQIEGKLLKKDQELKQKYPPTFVDHKISSGYMPLCPVSEESKYHAYILVQ